MHFRLFAVARASCVGRSQDRRGQLSLARCRVIWRTDSTNRILRFDYYKEGSDTEHALAATRRHHFLAAISRNMALSRIASADSFFSLALSSANIFSRRVKLRIERHTVGSPVALHQRLVSVESSLYVLFMPGLWNSRRAAHDDVPSQTDSGWMVDRLIKETRR